MSCSVTEVAIAGQSDPFGQKEAFPLVLQLESPSDLAGTVDWLRASAAFLAGKAARHGAILFRGFPLATADDFDAFVAAFGLRNFPYEESLSNAVRISRTERVFTANEAPPEVNILLHHEMAQTPIFPSRLFFFCEQPAETGGATPICRSDVLLDRLENQCPEFVRNCESKGLLYSNVMPGESDPKSGMGRSWRSTFRAESRGEAEARMASLGYTWEWQADGSLRSTTPVLPAVKELSTGRRSFFNQLIAASKGWKDDRNDPSRAITFGDGTPLDVEAVHTASELADGITFDIPWQRGDVALVDNFVVMHGRRTFTGTRKVLASLVAVD
jgi:hypothetical protein